MRPLAIDLFCGLGGWTEGLLAEDYRVVGFDIERHRYWMPELPDGDGSKGTKPVEKRGWTQGCAITLGMEGANQQPRNRLVEYPAQLVLQDVLTLHGSQFRNAARIVASPPCQRYSYMAMPWSRAKAQAAKIRTDETGEKLRDLNALFDACFRIQREACEAAGHYVPMVVENVVGAQKWVGRAAWHYGSFYLWGDVPAIMPHGFHRKVPVYSDPLRNGGKGAHLTSGEENRRGLESQKRPVWFNDDKRKCGGDWFGAGKDCSLMRSMSSRSTARKAASAQIAKIPFELAQYIASVYRHA